MTKKLLLVFFFTVLWLAIQAQQNPFNRFKLDFWDTKNGVPANSVLGLYQSKDGFIWINGYFGISRFDGVTFKTFNSRNEPLMKTDGVMSPMTETNDSTLWIATSNSGLLAYKEGHFTAYMQNYSSLLLGGRSEKEELLFSTSNGKYPYVLFDTRSKKYTDVSDSMLQVLFLSGKIFLPDKVDKEGNQWLLINDKIRRIYKGKVFELNSQEVAANEVKIDKQVNVYDLTTHNLYVDRQGKIWDATNKGLFLWDGKSMASFPGMENKVFVDATSDYGLLREDREGGLWAITLTGLNYLPPKAERFVSPPETHPLFNQAVSNIVEDREGNLWVTTQKGLYKLARSKFDNYSHWDGLPDARVSAVCAMDSNRYLAATEGKLFIIENGRISPYVFKNWKGLDFLEVMKLYKDSRGNIWACTPVGVLKITNKGEQLYGPGKAVRYAFEDEDKKMWFGIVSEGIAFINEKDDLEMQNLPQVDFKPMFISSIRKLKNGNWFVGAYNKGMVLIDKSGKPDYISDMSGVKDFTLFDSYEDAEGSLWLATGSGIARYKDGKLSNIGFRDGIPDAAVFDFLPDHEGNVWLPTNKGLVEVKMQELSDYLDKKINKINWKLYDEGDGMISRECVGARHIIITPGGKILVPTSRGLVEVTPGRLITNTIPPPVAIHRIVRDDKEIEQSTNLSFAPGNHRYIFEYSALSLVAPEKVQIKFKLDGYDKDWITSVGDRKAFYTNIPSGDYTFRVIAANNDGVWNETGAGFSFTVKPFFYETTWFRVLLAIALSSLIWIIIIWRTKAIKKQNELLETQVAARTNELNKANIELNQSNAAIAIQRDNLEKTLSELKSAQDQLIQSEKMASLGELTAGIAHEIQNPLNFVNNFSEVNNELIEEVKSQKSKLKTEELDRLLSDIFSNNEKISHHGKRADAIVKGMLQHSRTSSGQKELTDINALTDEYLRLAYHGLRAKDKSFNAKFETGFDNSIGKVNIVPQEIGRVILNLINNAFYAVSEKQKQVTTPFQPTVTISTKKLNGKIELSVRDNGNGIPQKILEKIFQPFFTTKPTGVGTGLGLSLSYDIITKGHGGELRVENKEGEGATFIITIPVT